MKFVAMAAMVAAAPAEEDWKIDLDNLQGGLEAGDQEYFFPRGTKVTVTGIENRSWGYEWGITNECKGMKLVDDVYGYEHSMGDSETLSLGRKGRRTLTFETSEFDNKQGIEMCSITFANKRPWLLEADSPDQVKKIQVTIGELLGDHE